MPGQKLIAKIITFALFALLISSFAIWGIGDIFRTGGQSRSVAEVGDQTIDLPSFTNEFNRELNRLSRRFGTQLTGEQALALGLDRQVLEQLVSRSLFEQQADDLRLLITEDQVRRQIVQEPAFKDEFGNFSRDRFLQGLRNAGMGEGGYVATLQRDLRRSQLVGSMLDATVAPQLLADATYAYQQERRVARYVLVPKAEASTIAAPEDAALEEFYSANLDNYMAPEYRAITLVELRPEDFAEEISISEEALQEAFEARRADFTVPEKRGLEQIVFQDEASAKAALEGFTAAGSFAALADGVEGARHVDLGLVTRDDLLPALAEPAFNLAQNQPSAPLQSPLGWHLVLVSAIEPGHEANFEDARETLEKDLAAAATVESTIAMANEFDDAMGGGLDIEGAASQLGLFPRKIGVIDPDGKDRNGDPVEDLPPLAVLGPVLTGTAAGETSILTQTSSGGYFILRVDSVTPPAPRPLEDVRERVVGLWTEGERAKQAREKAEDLIKRLQEGENFETLAAAENLEIATTEGIRRDEIDPTKTPARGLPAQLFQVGLGKFVSTSAENGEVVAELTEIVRANPAEDGEVVGAVRDSLAAGIQDDLLAQFLAALRQKYGVTVNQATMREALSFY